MGVLGLTPFLQKTYPQVIHKLPNRLRDLAGKKLVIDGTLITQRLHYAPSPHPFRHVLGWYHLAREMSNNDVSAVCIFDGQKRSLAKAEELDRRRETRRLDVSRGALELSRAKRLNTLKTAMTSLRSLDDKSKSTIAETLSRLSPREGSGTVGVVDGLNKVVERLRALEEAPLPTESKKEPVLIPESQTMVSRQDAQVTVPEAHGIEPLPTPSAEDLKAVLLSSYRDFKSSISKVACLPLVEHPAPPSSVLVTPDESEVKEAKEDLVLSKTQHELTLEEGKLWDELTLATTSGFVMDNFMLSAAQDRLEALTSKSGVLADSYQRRMCVPTKETYMESREILEAMGVPCYEIEGVCEGEALASSLVHKGLADYVVSEDSDVLVYEAPLIRNISSRSDPLVLIHGGDVRTALDLAKDAYIDFAILLGTDFSRRIKNVGPSRAYKFIKEYGTIENVIDKQTKYQPSLSHPEYLAQVDLARTIFHSLPPIPHRLIVSMTSAHPKVDEAKVAVIMERCGLGKVLMVDAFWDFEAALSGNYFGDDPSIYAP